MDKLHLYYFKFLGKQGDHFVIRAPTWNTETRGSMGVLYFTNQVFDWLFENATDYYHVSHGGTSDYPTVPALANGNSLCVLFQNKNDLLKFSNFFPVRQIADITGS